MKNELSNKTYVVTGASSGIGLAVTDSLLSLGASVIGVGRSAQNIRKTEQLLSTCYPDGRFTYFIADLAEQAEVKSVSAKTRDLLESRNISALDGLVNNAGTFTYWFTQSSEGIEMQWAVNHLAPFLLTTELLPLLKAAPSSRVVTVSSDSHYGARLDWSDLQLRRHYNGLKAYGNTKLANILFSQEVNRRYGHDYHIQAFAADPGLVKTEIGFKGTPAVVRWIWNIRRSGGVSPEEAARGIVALLADPSIQSSDGVYWKNGHIRKPSRAALDLVSASRLWNSSLRMCGLDEED